jgi:hypothetical protein
MILRSRERPAQGAEGISLGSGRLWAVGSPGRGATFHLSLPAARKVP